jgi:hypothetical protein
MIELLCIKARFPHEMVRLFIIIIIIIIIQNERTV